MRVCSGQSYCDSVYNSFTRDLQSQSVLNTDFCKAELECVQENYVKHYYQVGKKKAINLSFVGLTF